MKTVFYNAKVITPGRVINNGGVEVQACHPIYENPQWEFRGINA